MSLSNYFTAIANSAIFETLINFHFPGVANTDEIEAVLGEHEKDAHSGSEVNS